MWNYRIIRHRTKRAVYYGLHEVYYRKNGKIYLWAPDAEVTGDTKDEIVAHLALMLRDATRSDMKMLKASEMPGNRKAGKKT